jgi:anaerobic selenocysteine-containing dehydrogenase
MTNHWIDIKNADVILIMGSNAADTGTLLNHTLDMILAIITPRCANKPNRQGNFFER